jgi:hypothetical protein
LSRAPGIAAALPRCSVLYLYSGYTQDLNRFERY